MPKAKESVDSFFVCSKAKINQGLLLIIHHQPFIPVFIRHTLSIIRRHAENTLRCRKDNISAGVCHHKAWMLGSGKLYQQCEAQERV